jgi:hypothetical protein
MNSGRYAVGTETESAERPTGVYAPGRMIVRPEGSEQMNGRAHT